MNRSSGTLRIVLFSCAGAPLGAEILNHVRDRDPAILQEIIAVVLSRPRPPRSRVSDNRMNTEQGTGILSKLSGGLAWRWNKLVWRAGILSRSIISNVIAVRYRRIEDFCKQQQLPVYTTTDVNSPDSIAFLTSLEPDLIVMTTFHNILKAKVISIPSIAALNIHCSMLPRHRGADPIGMALSEGVSETGITIHWVDEGVDTGDVVMQQAVPVGDARTDDELRPKLARVGADLLIECLDQARHGVLSRRPQDHRIRGPLTSA